MFSATGWCFPCPIGHTKPVKLTQPYSQQLIDNALSKRFFCEIDVADLIATDQQLANELTRNPEETIPLVRLRHAPLFAFCVVL